MAGTLAPHPQRGTLKERTFKPSDASGLIEYRTYTPSVPLFLRYATSDVGTLYEIVKGIGNRDTVLTHWVPR